MSIPAPTVSEVARIAALADPVLRNLQITHCYHRLALTLAERLGFQANWCTFATWASKQAGQTIRKEDLGRTADAFMGDAAHSREVERLTAAARRIGVRLKSARPVELMWKAADPEGAFAHSSEAVARGNLKVFAEIGSEFARFIAGCFSDAQFDQSNVDRFIEGLRPGPPPDGQDFLRRAFRGYYKALFETEPKARAERLLLANLLVGYHEQTRLQPEIVEALEAPVISPQAFTRRLVEAYYPDSPWRAGAVLALLRTAGRLVGFDALVAGHLFGARRQVQSLVTETLMAIELPPQTRLRLGQDLPAGFPEALQHIADPDLATLLVQVDPTPDSRAGSGTDFWGDFDDRMHFIADLFRVYHFAGELFDPPFSTDQAAAIMAGRLPDGRL